MERKSGGAKSGARWARFLGVGVVSVGRFPFFFEISALRFLFRTSLSLPFFLRPELLYLSVLPGCPSCPILRFRPNLPYLQLGVQVGTFIA